MKERGKTVHKRKQKMYDLIMMVLKMDENSRKKDEKLYEIGKKMQKNIKVYVEKFMKEKNKNINIINELQRKRR